MFLPLLLLLSNIALCSPLALINSTALAANDTIPTPPINFSFALQDTDLILSIRSHIPHTNPLDTNIVPGFTTAANLNLYSYIHDHLARGASTRFENVYSFRSQTTGYRLLWWGGEYRNYGVDYGDLLAGLGGLMKVASWLYEEVDLELGHVGGGRGLRPVTGRIYKDGRAGDEGVSASVDVD